MARAIWTGSISFGLVNVPVRLYTATESTDVRFHELREGSSERIRHKRVGEESGEEVDYDDIVKGYEVEGGTFVTVTPEELEAVEPGQTKTIDIEDFVSLDEIDPIYFEKAYYVGPAANAGASKPYELLRRVLERTGKVGIARFVLRTKQHLAVVRPLDGALVLETLFFADEVRPAGVVDHDPSAVDVGKRELSIAEQLIDSLTTEWEPERYEDTYRARVLELIERKAEGETISLEPGERPAEVIDLMAALEASVQSARQGRRASGHDGDGAGHDLDGMTVEELRDLARRHDVKGRSKMNRDELIGALRSTGATPRSKAS